MEAQIIPTIAQRCRAAGVSFCTEISLSELYSREPGLRKQAQGALWIPGETVVDPWLTAISLAHDAKKKGAMVSLTFTSVNLHWVTIIQMLSLWLNISPYFQIKTNAVVQNISRTECERQRIQVMTSLGQFTGRVVINCGGLYGDIVDKLAGLQHFRYSKQMLLSYIYFQINFAIYALTYSV